MKRVREGNINTQENWDEIYATPESATRWTQWGADDLVVKVASQIPAGSTVLDVATGAGLGPQAIAKLRPDIRWWGCDASIAAIRYLRKYSPVDWQGIFQADLTVGIPLKDGFAGVVMCTELLEHLERPEDALKELRRLATHKLIITVPRDNVVDTDYHVWALSVNDVLAMLSPYGRVHTDLARSNRQIIGVCELA